MWVGLLLGSSYTLWNNNLCRNRETCAGCTGIKSVSGQALEEFVLSAGRGVGFFLKAKKKKA
jgi:hypothetical protein